jgi:hypothetical protein
MPRVTHLPSNRPDVQIALAELIGNRCVGRTEAFTPSLSNIPVESILGTAALWGPTGMNDKVMCVGKGLRRSQERLELISTSIAEA